MLRILKNALLIATPYSIISSLLAFAVTLNWAAVSDGENQTIYYGFDTVKFLIKSYGVVNYFLGLVPQFIFIFTVMIPALITQGYIFYRKP
ncbi:hypothetical protein H3222_23580 [Pseudomonas chengduensis]|jgi:hypothetical protein|nr:hypothetical protein [Pseudomonas chengduensis]MBG0848182.1 hypothetical protein [Pseudomonas chengduensis]